MLPTTSCSLPSSSVISFLPLRVPLDRCKEKRLLPFGRLARAIKPRIGRLSWTSKGGDDLGGREGRARSGGDLAADRAAHDAWLGLRGTAAIQGTGGGAGGGGGPRVFLRDQQPQHRQVSQDDRRARCGLGRRRGRAVPCAGPCQRQIRRHARQRGSLHLPFTP